MKLLFRYLGSITPDDKPNKTILIAWKNPAAL